ncbi:hypothetical protein KY329_05720 [Candidatus Woesearchaeota archaeon]|nr:hypothetical protein [Candidatus Woesearchaeota archaeon]
MPASVLGDVVGFRRALYNGKGGPKDLHYLLEVRKKIHAGTPSSLSQAFEMLENRKSEPTTYMKGQIARMYEQICRTADEELAKQSKERAVELYRKAGQSHRAAYLEMLTHAQKCSW